MEKNRIHRVTLLALMIAMDVVLSPLMRIEGMAPMSSVMNIIAGVLLGPLYGTLMALVCGLIRMTFLGIPPLALTGAVFGAFFAGLFYQWGQKLGWSMLGEIFGTGIIGSLLSYPVMVWFTGSKQNFYWFIYTPRFIGATLIGSVIAWLVLVKLKETRVFKQTQELFLGGYFMKTSVKFETIFPLTTAPLIQCITNEITCESMANALLYIDAKPIMADDPREFPQLFQQTSALVLNLGHLSQEREQSLLAASDYARQVTKPTVVDLVGYGASDIRNEVGEKLVHNQPTVVKGNLSEMRTFCQLVSHGRGVDGSPLDQSEEAIEELIQALRQQTQKFPQTVFLATGIQDVLVSQEQVIVLQNGVPELDCFTGTGDLVGALVAALLGEGNAPMTAAVAAVSYFNLCGEKAKTKSQGLADFRQNTLNQLSLLMKEKDWFEAVKGRVL